ncbi:MAG: hypothetical protein AAGK21_05085 [Bacteroidota bacterium]
MITDEFVTFAPGWAPGCDNYIAYGFGGTGADASDVVLELGPVEDGDRVAIEHLFEGTATSGLVPRLTFPSPNPSSTGVWFWDGVFFDGFPLLSNLRAEFEETMGEPIEVMVDRDSVLITESARVTVSGVSHPDSLVTLAAPSPHGRLFRVVGTDTTEVTGPLAFSDIEAAKVLFTADGVWPEADAAVTITAELGDGSAGTALLTVAAPALAVEFDVDPATYLPVKDDTLTATVRLENVPTGFRSTVALDLIQDYEFTYLDGSTGTRSVPLAGDAARVRLLSQTWWGVATLRASVEGSAPGDTLASEVQVPVDTDGDTIADVWELNPVNGGTLGLGGTNSDGGWNDETSPGNANNGDAFTKLAEYQGVLIGADHRRLQPLSKEVFFDIRSATAGGFVASEVQSQLGITVYTVDGAKNEAGNSVGPTTPGANALTYVSPTTKFFGGKAVVFVLDENYVGPGDGNVISGGIWAATGTTTQPGGPNLYSLTFGTNRGTARDAGAVSRCYVSTISNVWNNNSIRETATITFPFLVAETSGSVLWTARYANVDLNGNSTINDPLNPFDIAAPSPPPNNPEDTIVATLSELDMIRFNTLHEVGHALGMSLSTPAAPGGSHPPSGNSTMRSGPGPAKTGTFSSADISQVDL